MTTLPPSADSPDAAAPAPRARSRGGVRWLVRVVVLLFFVIGIALLALRELVLPRIDEHREWIAQRLSQAIGVEVRIDRLSADLPGAGVRLQASGIAVGDGASALRLERVEAQLGWSSLLSGRPYFRNLTLIGPDLTVIREADASLHVAGVELGGEGDGGGLAAWLFAQGEVAIVDARIAWDDRLRGAPLLQLEEVGLRVERIAGRYRFGLQGRPDAALAGRVDVRGDLVSDQPADPARWNGQLYG
ncbi:MAG: TIGR02099 family protein, partial [Pseudazoarcus pumilus]|nr:TIGR02099 family protein [Pseudazoarcus pumilus]